MPLPTCVKYIVFIMRVFAYIQHTKTRHSIFLHLFFISFNFKIASLLNEDQDLKNFFLKILQYLAGCKLREPYIRNVGWPEFVMEVFDGG